MIFFEIKVLLPDEVFDSESNGRNLSSLAPPGGEKKYSHKISDENARVYSSRHFEKIENIFLAPRWR